MRSALQAPLGQLVDLGVGDESHVFAGLQGASLGRTEFIPAFGLGQGFASFKGLAKYRTSPIRPALGSVYSVNPATS